MCIVLSEPNTTPSRVRHLGNTVTGDGGARTITITKLDWQFRGLLSPLMAPGVIEPLDAPEWILTGGVEKVPGWLANPCIARRPR